MIFSKIFILLGAISSALCGGTSKCGTLQNDFAGLLQGFESIIDGVVNLVNDTVISWPYIARSNIEGYFCTQNTTNYIFAKGLSQVSGVDIDYILGAFNGTIKPPFMEPLDCIDNEILSYYLLTENIIINLVPQWESFVQKSPINESTPCSTVLEIETPYYQRDVQVAVNGANAGIKRAAIFKSIGRTNLYLDYITAIRPCGADTLSKTIAEILNVNVSIVNELLTNSSISVPPPLSCVKGLITSFSDALYSTYNLINNTVANPSTPPNCEPFNGQFVTFERFWYKYLNELRDYATNQSVAYPELTSFLIANLYCEVDTMVMFAANATSYLSGVDSDIIYEIIKGSRTPPFAAPLDCISNQLLFMNSQVSILVNSLIPGLENFAANSTSDTSTCNTTYQALTPYVGKLVTLLNKKGSIMTNATIDFKSINFDDLFLGSFESVLDCLPNLVGKYVGGALNNNGASVTAFVSGNRSTLQYPFSCVNIIINIVNSIFNQALVNFVTDSAANVVTAPKIPNYRG